MQGKAEPVKKKINQSKTHTKVKFPIKATGMEHAIVNKIRAILMNRLDLVAYPPTRVAV
jgi:hypothetical protein